MVNSSSGSSLASLWQWPAEREWPWLLAGALVYLSFGFTEMMGSDLWWHLAAGREIVQNGSVWLVDDWSYTEFGSAWHNHEWLADLVFYGWAQLFGVPSLVVWKWLVIVASFTLVQRALARTSGSAPAALLATLMAMVLAAPFLDMRPQLYTLLGLGVLLNLTLLRPARLRELLPLFLIWANTHGGFVFGLMLLGILILPWRGFSLPALTRAAVVWLACALVCLLNPDGVQIFWLPLVYALNDDSPYRSLAEWRSPFESGGISSPLYAYSLCLGAALAMTWVLPRVRRWVPFLPEALFAALLTAAMSATSRRFIILWALALAVLLAPFLAAFLRQRLLQPLLLPALLLVCVWGVIRLAPYPLRPAVAYHYLTAEYSYPEGIADFVETNGLQGKTFAYYNWGGYLHWRGDGVLRVFLDGRANTLFDDATYLDYVAVLGQRPGWIERIEDSGAELFLWPHARGGDRLIQGLMQTRRWILLYDDSYGALLARAGVSLPPTLRLPRDNLAADLRDSYLAMRQGDSIGALAAARSAHARRPWDQAACSTLKRALQGTGQGAAATQLMDACRDWFPSRYLR